jgi:uncharacterized FlaG/YvyC family protein
MYQAFRVNRMTKHLDSSVKKIHKLVKKFIIYERSWTLDDRIGQLIFSIKDIISECSIFSANNFI